MFMKTLKNRRRRAIAFALVLLGAGLLLALVPGPGTAEGSSGIKIFINEQALTMDQPPTTIDGRVLVPFRVLFEALGGTVTWDPETKTVTGRRGDTTIALQIEDRIAVVNQNKVALDVAARVINGRTMVPLRFVSENLGARVEYDEETQAIGISLKTVEGVYLDQRNLEMEIGEAVTLKATAFPQDAFNKKVHWRSSNPRAARITRISDTEAIVTAQEGGQTTIIVETEEGRFTDTCRVEVQHETVPVTQIALSRTHLTMSQGEPPLTIRAMITPDNATNPRVSWSSDDSKVVMVNRSGIGEALITPMEEGETFIKARTEDGGYEAICRVIVEKYAVPVRGISLSRRTITIDLEEDYRTLTASIEPRSASNQNMTWKIDDQKVVGLEKSQSGEGYQRVRLVPLAAGSTRVTATTEDGLFTASCLVTVE